MTLKNVVLPAPLGPIRPQVPPGNVTVIPSIGVTPPKRTLRLSTSITSILVLDPNPPTRSDEAPDQPSEVAHVPRELHREASGCSQEHLQQPDTEDDVDDVDVGDAPASDAVDGEQVGDHVLEDASHDRAPEAE